MINVDRPDVLEAARRRTRKIFDAFEHVVVSVSGGKDSTVIRDLVLQEAEHRGRKVGLFFLDQEAEYASTIDIIGEWMQDPRIDPMWYQVPIRMTNATSHKDAWLRAWGEGEEWMRPKHPVAIHSIAEPYPDRFYDFFEWQETHAKPGTAFVVGVRAMESMNRQRAVTKNPGINGWAWTTKTKKDGVFRVYPIYDWTVGDVWKHIADAGLRYNAYYDRMFVKYGANLRSLRVSNLIHEQAFRCLADLQEFEPDTYERLVKRLGGVHAAALYSKEKGVYSAGDLPATFSTWRQYRDYLIASTPSEKTGRFIKRFEGQSTDEATCKNQVRQILTNDWENNVPVPNAKKARLRELWWPRL